MLDLSVFVYRHSQWRIRQTMGQNYEKIRTERKRVIFLQWCEMHLTFLYIKNYSSVYKEMSALNVTDQNLGALSQRV